MRHMLNILILTVITLVIIAAGVQLCRSKDHGKADPIGRFTEVSVTENGIGFTTEVDSLTSAYLYHLASHDACDSNNEIITRSPIPRKL